MGVYIAIAEKLARSTHHGETALMESSRGEASKHHRGKGPLRHRRHIEQEKWGYDDAGGCWGYWCCSISRDP